MAFTTSLISYWKLDEVNTTATDSHGSNNLTDSGGSTGTTGKINNGRDFEADSNQVLSHSSNSDLTTGDIDFTITAWVNLESKTNIRQIVTKWDDISAANTSEFSLFYHSGFDRFRFDVENPDDTIVTIMADTFGVPSTSTWYFIVAWHDAGGNTTNIQINDGAVDTSGWSGGVRSSTSNFKIGSWDNPDAGRYMDGIIDEVGFWKRVLTSGERTALYNSGNGLAYPFYLGEMLNWNGLARASIKNFNGLAIASVKNWNAL